MFDIKKIRLSAYKTQVEFAQLIGVSVSAIQMWEAKKRNPSIRNQQTIVDFCEKYGIDYKTGNKVED